jgi:two-component system sensor histidine kinase YesM
MTLYYPVTNYFTFSRMGFLAVHITADTLEFLAGDSSDNPGELVLIKDRMNRTIVSNLPPAFSPEVPARRGWFSYTGTMMDGEWAIQIFRKLSLNPFAGLGGYNLVFLLLIPIIAIFVMINLSFSRYLSVPIVKCKNAMLEIRNDNFGVTVENHYHDEIGELIDGFNEMSGALVTLLRQNASIDKLRRDAEIDALQQKVNPHFLYNTLEIINALIFDGQNSEAVQVCEILGHIYHYNLMNRKWVTLRDECDYVRRYLMIFRYKINGLQVVWDLEEEALETDILKLVLQPLVENAVLHGLRAKSADPCLTITVRAAEEQTEILIMDNGSGIPPETLADIEQNLELVRKKNFAEGPHIGIRNV